MLINFILVIFLSLIKSECVPLLDKVFPMYVDGNITKDILSYTKIIGNRYNNTWEIEVSMITKNTIVLQNTYNYDNFFEINMLKFYPQLYIFNIVNDPIQWIGNFFNIQCNNTKMLFQVFSIVYTNKKYNKNLMISSTGRGVDTQKINLYCNK